MNYGWMSGVHLSLHDVDCAIRGMQSKICELLFVEFVDDVSLSFYSKTLACAVK